MKRRYLLSAFCALAVGPSTLAYAQSLQDCCRQRGFHERIAELSRYPASAEQIAQIYQAGLPNPKPAAVVLDELEGIFGHPSAHLARLGDKELLAIVKSSITKDFEEAHIFDLNGWLMSKTEVLLCVLIASHQQEHVGMTVTSSRRTVDHFA